jgi:small subunit ribosomal protein S4
MGRYIGPWVRIDRRFGVVVSGKKSAPKILSRRNYPPGQHGRIKGRKRKLTEYGLRLMEKQKLKFLYGGIREKQFKKYFEMASKSKGNTGQVLLQLLERRLDNVVYRLGFACTRRQARQFVAHGHILVNGKKVNIPSYLVSVGDVIEVKPSSRDIPQIRENLPHLRSPCDRALGEGLWHNRRKLLKKGASFFHRGLCNNGSKGLWCLS